ncbi:MAG: hypothetical protein HC866_27130 [Leptolyngbyaceae cyanobacterium RU_5_1]|nr:hypothetical protein [Leptolyngbyaceae cyanobacterium RU_5_1]
MQQKVIPLNVEIAADLVARIEHYLESKLPDPEAAAILQQLEDSEIERTAKALRERYIISEPSPNYSIEKPIADLWQALNGGYQ